MTDELVLCFIPNMDCDLPAGTRRNIIITIKLRKSYKIVILY